MGCFFNGMAVCPDCRHRKESVVLCFLGGRFKSGSKLVAPVGPLRVRASRTRLTEVFYGSSFGSSCQVLGNRVHGLNFGVPPLIGTCVDLDPAVHVFNATVGCNFKSMRRANVLVTISRVLRRGQVHRVRSFIGGSPRSYRVASKIGGIFAPGIIAPRRSYSH